MCCCFLLSPTSAGESHSLRHAPMVCAMSVILDIDCCVFSPHYWGCMEHNSQWVLHPRIFQQHCDRSVMCCCFLPSPTSDGESHSLRHAWMLCVCQWTLLVTAVFYLLITGNAWTITDSEYCIPTSFSNTVTEVLCVAVFSFLPPQSVSLPLYLMLQLYVQCQWSLLLTAVFCLHTTGNAWNITASEYCIPASSSNTVTEVLCVAVFSFLPPQWVSPTLYDMPQLCVQFKWSLLLTAVFSLHTAGNAWNMTASEYCTSTSASDTVRIMVVICCWFFFLMPQPVSPTHCLMP